MVIILAGQVAEEVEHDNDGSFQVGNGATDDLQMATCPWRTSKFQLSDSNQE